MTFTKRNAADHGFNQWAINDAVFSSDSMKPEFHLRQGKRYRLRMHNASDDIHPIHLHRHSFELTKLAGMPTAGVMKDVVMVGGYQEVEVDFTADNPGLTLFTVINSYTWTLVSWPCSITSDRNSVAFAPTPLQLVRRQFDGTEH